MGEASAAQRVDTQIECLPDEILVEILCRMRLKEAGRTSVLSRRWRYLWSSSRSLCFGPRDDDDDDDESRTAAMVGEKFRSWVNRVLELHQAPQLDKFVVRTYFPEADVRADEVDTWVDFVIRKEVKVFELSFEFVDGYCPYEFPNVEKYAFRSLRSLRLYYVNVKDEIVHNILASCLYLEALVIIYSQCTRNLQVLDPLPNLKLLEITDCEEIQSLEVSVTSLVWFKYSGYITDRSHLKNVPNLSEVSLDGGYASSFIYEGNRHSSYSAQLVELELRIFHRIAYCPALPRLDSLKRLELHIHSQVGESLVFFTLFTKAAPLLCQFKIKLHYTLDPKEFWFFYLLRIYAFSTQQDMTYAAESTEFYHENLKLVEMEGYIGCPSEEKFLLQLCKMAPSLEKVVIDTSGFQFDKEPVLYDEKITKETGASTRAEAMECAKNLKFTSLLGAGGNMIMSSTETKVIWQVEDIPGIKNAEPDQHSSVEINTGTSIPNSKGIKFCF